MSTVETSTANNPWFAVSIGLMGLILGFSVASFTGSSFGIRMAPGSSQAPAIPDVPPPPAKETPPTPVPDITAEDHYRGSSDAKVTVIEYLDYECPFCHRNAATVKTVMETYGDKVAHVIRHFPLDFHPNAMPYANAAECIASLGGETAFWKFSDEVFAAADQGIDAAKLPGLAKLVGVNATKFDECYKANTFKAKIDAQQQAAIPAGINGTPGVVVVNNVTKAQTRLPGAVPFSDYQAAIDAYLNE